MLFKVAKTMDRLVPLTKLVLMDSDLYRKLTALLVVARINPGMQFKFGRKGN